jgi:hypothetical protein
VFVEATHKQGDVGQTMTPSSNYFLRLQEFGLGDGFAPVITDYEQGEFVDFLSLVDDLGAIPGFSQPPVNPQHQMVVVRHDGIGANVDGKDIRKLP